ncbi:methyltransferase family protein [Ferrovibrio xuzhouensis]|uniref:Methyltransferase family protein n=1 Tax=Ferrovibrio xuzhouensis TaxID=1576914 RepID=A0ABV7VIB3_9PROT
MSDSATPQKNAWIRVGDFFFRYRNAAFPVVLLGLFLAFQPAGSYFGEVSLEHWTDGLAVAITLVGLVVRAAVIGFAYIKRGGLNKRVYADGLVTGGIFGVCRNPLYLGNMLIYAGVFLMHGHPVVVALGIISYFLIYQSIIAAEEFFLRGKFGQAYADYCRAVPRWLPGLSGLKESTRGMTFNFRRVLVKDYTTVANAAMALLLLKLLETYHNEPRINFDQALTVILPVVALVLATTGFIALAKRRKWLHA